MPPQLLRLIADYAPTLTLTVPFRSPCRVLSLLGLLLGCSAVSVPLFDRFVGLSSPALTTANAPRVVACRCRIATTLRCPPCSSVRFFRTAAFSQRFVSMVCLRLGVFAASDFTNPARAKVNPLPRSARRAGSRVN